MRSALRSAASMCFPSSNNVSVIYERLDRKTQRCAIGPLSLSLSLYHNKLTPASKGVCVRVCVCRMGSEATSLLRGGRRSPLGGGLTSVSPCWFELSDCPDCSERENKRGRGGGREREKVSSGGHRGGGTAPPSAHLTEEAEITQATAVLEITERLVRGESGGELKLHPKTFFSTSSRK